MSLHVTGQIGWKVSAAFIAPFLCTAMPPAGVKDPLFLHSALSEHLLSETQDFQTPYQLQIIV